MTLLVCPYCGKGKPELKVIPELETRFEGVMIKVPNAEISQCPECGEKTYHAKELKRWERIMKMKIVERKVFENFYRCDDRRAWETACEEQANDSYRAFDVSEAYEDDSDLEHLRQWLLSNGATEADKTVFLSICW